MMDDYISLTAPVTKGPKLCCNPGSTLKPTLRKAVTLKYKKCLASNSLSELKNEAKLIEYKHPAQTN